ncbi:MAG: DUF5005 domain-containing protein [Saprospiraceae bacterium]
MGIGQPSLQLETQPPITAALSGSGPADYHFTAGIDTDFTEYFRRYGPGWNAGDATISISLPNDQVLWLFGDSYMGVANATTELMPCLFQVRNAAMLQDLNDPENLITLNSSNPYTDFFRSTEPGTHFWPGQGYYFQDTVYVFLHQRSGFDLLGNYVAKLTYPELEVVRIDRLPLGMETAWGKACIIDEAAGYIYNYGTLNFKGRIARYPVNTPLQNWTFFDGNGWTSVENDGKNITGFSVSSTYSVTEIEGSYYLITQQLGYLTCGLGRKIFAYKAEAPQGPFRLVTTVFTVEDKLGEDYLNTYNAYAHHLFPDDDELLISYNVNDYSAISSCPQQCATGNQRHPDSYRPKFFRVSFNTLNPELADNDGDGYPASEDCNDHDPDIHPGAAEICNGIDDNCNGQTDEGLMDFTYYRDQDQDNYGNPDLSITTCENLPPEGYTANDEDCDDDNPNIHPGAAEICNGIDDNCNGQTDEDLMNFTYYRDQDQDAYGNPDLSITTCDNLPPEGYTTNDEDCDDDNPDIHPGATESCNDIDDNCNGQTDEGLMSFTYYRDQDQDAYGNPDLSITTCDNLPPEGYTTNDQDCDDDNPDIYPGATETPDNEIDEDCNGMDLITGTADPQSGKTIKVFPNPTQTQLFISCDCSMPAQIKLMNLWGQVIRQDQLQLTSNRERFNLSQLPNGVYWVVIQDQDGQTLTVEPLLKIE